MTTPYDPIVAELSELLSHTILRLLLLLIMVYAILFMTTKIVSEGLELADYLTVGTLVFAFSLLSFVLISMVFSYHVVNESSFIENIWMMRLLMFAGYVALLAMPLLIAVRHAFMFWTTRMFLWGLYLVMLPIVLTLIT